MARKIKVTANTATEAAALVAAKLGDNKRLPITEFEAIIVRATSTDVDLINAVKCIDVDQKEVRGRAMAAHWYALDYSAQAESGKLSATRASGVLVIPPMTDEKRRYYGKLLQGAAPDAKKLGADQVRRTVEQDKIYAACRKWWQRLLMKAGVMTVERRGGARVKKGKAKLAKGAKSQAMPAAAPALAILPPVPNAAKAGAWLYDEAKRMAAFVAKNKTHAAQFQTLVNAFMLDVAKLTNKLEHAPAAAPAKK